MSAALGRQKHPFRKFNFSMCHGARQQPKNNFCQGINENWTKVHFTLSHARPDGRGSKRSVYKLVDYNIDEVKGSWYP